MKRLVEILISFAAGILLIEVYFYSGAYKKQLNSNEMAIMFLTAGVLFLLITYYFAKLRTSKKKSNKN